MFAGYSDVLQLWHEFTVKTAHGVSCQESVTLVLQVTVDLGQLGHQGVLAVLVLLDQHQLKLAVHVLNDPGNFFVLNSVTHHFHLIIT